MIKLSLYLSFSRRELSLVRPPLSVRFPRGSFCVVRGVVRPWYQSHTDTRERWVREYGCFFQCVCEGRRLRKHKVVICYDYQRGKTNGTASSLGTSVHSGLRIVSSHVFFVCLFVCLWRKEAVGYWQSDFNLLYRNKEGITTEERKSTRRSQVCATPTIIASLTKAD